MNSPSSNKLPTMNSKFSSISLKKFNSFSNKITHKKAFASHFSNQNRYSSTQCGNQECPIMPQCGCKQILAVDDMKMNRIAIIRMLSNINVEEVCVIVDCGWPEDNRIL
jgi:hypothetical protein